MKHGDYLVDILDERGRVVDNKRRAEINKLVDVYNGVYIIIVTPQRQLVLSNITERQDLPNLYARKLGSSCAAIRRSDETAAQAAKRCLKAELLLDLDDFKLLGESFVRLADNRKTLVTAYSVVAEPPTKYSTVDIESLKLVTIDQFESELRSNPDHFAPTLRAIWELYGEQLKK